MSTIPRLLLRPLLRAPPPSTTLKPFTHRYASTIPPKTLAKPTKFTPPSHPSSLPRNRDPINYPGPPTPPRDPTRQYPHTMPPPNTWAHWALTSRILHFYISMGILVGLAGFVSVQNFLRTSPFASQMYWDWKHPIFSVKSMFTALKEHVEEESRKVGETRKRKAEDVELRGEYRRAHGLEKMGDEGGFGGWGVKRSGREPGAMDNVVPGIKAPGLRRGDWVEDQIRRAEEDAAKLAEAAAAEAAKCQVVPVPVEEPKEPEKKKSSWW